MSIVVFAGTTASALAAERPQAGTSKAERFLVGTKTSPPFSFQDESGRWVGISIELWRQVAAELNVDYAFVETDLDGLISGLEDGSYSASTAALTLSAAREERVDFTHPFYSTGLAIAVRSEQDSLWRSVSAFFSFEFLTALAALGGVLVAVGAAAWVFERKKNPEEFGGSPLQGLGSGFWWAAVTMTTVGYGDKSPKTLPGRIVGLIWMFAAIIIISSFTAAIATSLTVGRLGERISGVEDLGKFRVATVEKSTGADALVSRRIRYIPYASLERCLDDLSAGAVDAVVYDAPLLHWRIKQTESTDLRVLSNEFSPQDYAIALPAGSEYREAINRSILGVVDRIEWRQTLNRYLGD